MFVSGAGGMRFKSRAGQIAHSVANGSLPLRHFLKGVVFPAGTMTRKRARPIRYSFGVIQRE